MDEKKANWLSFVIRGISRVSPKIIRQTDKESNNPIRFLETITLCFIQRIKETKRGQSEQISNQIHEEKTILCCIT